MLGLASALLMAWLTGRLFAHMGNPRSCEWFGAKSPLCRWQEDFLPQKLRERVQDFVSNPLSTKAGREREGYEISDPPFFRSIEPGPNPNRIPGNEFAPSRPCEPCRCPWTRLCVERKSLS